MLNKIWDVIKSFFVGGKGILASRKVIYFGFWVILSGIQKFNPDMAASLPPIDLMTDLVMTLLLCHTVTDVSSVLGTFAVEYAKLKIPDKEKE